MKLPFACATMVLSLTLMQGLAKASGTEPERKLGDLHVIPERVLQRSISPKFYQTLLVSPVKGWIVVRANLSGSRLSGARIIHSELDGAYDALALQRAKEVLIAGNYSLDRPNVGASVLMHLLVYKTADGTLALSFAHLDAAGGDQMAYYGCSRLTVLKNDGTSVEIKGPSGLEGKGWAVRAPGFDNNLAAVLKMERIPGNNR